MVSLALKRAETDAATIDRSTVPPECSSEIIAAPARGPLLPYREGYWHEKDGQSEWRHMPYRSGCPGQIRDIFDTMAEQAMRRGGSSPFTAGQVGAARDYRALHERVQTAGVKCSKVFDVQMGGQGDFDFMTAYMRDTERLARLQDAIGSVIAKSMKRVRPDTAQRVVISDDTFLPADKSIITVRALVDGVCVKERSLSDILKRYGWSVTGKNRKVLQVALCAALDRMQKIY